MGQACNEMPISMKMGYTDMVVMTVFQGSAHFTESSF
jgi:hypothetical protein